MMTMMMTMKMTMTSCVKVCELAIHREPTAGCDCSTLTPFLIIIIIIVIILIIIVIIIIVIIIRIIVIVITVCDGSWAGPILPASGLVSMGTANTARHPSHWDYDDDDYDNDVGDDDPPHRCDQRSKRFNTDGHAILLSESTLLS